MSEDSPAPSAPKKSRLRKWSIRFLKTLGVLAVLLALVHAVEYWRGNRAYDRAQADWKAARLSDVGELLKDEPPVPDELNLLKAPFFSEWGRIPQTNAPYYRDKRWDRWGMNGIRGTNTANREWYRFDWRQLVGTPASEPTPWEQVLWRTNPEGSLNSPTVGSRKPTPLLRLAPVSGKSDAQVIVDAIEADYPELKTIVSSERTRTEIGFGRKAVAPEKLIFTQTVSFNCVREPSIALTVYALAKLDTGDSSVALAATRAALRHGAATEKTPILISSMIAQVQATICPLPLTHEALTKGAWNEDQLASADKAFEQYRPLRIFRKAIQTEGLCTAALLNSMDGLMRMGMNDRATKSGYILSACVPSGWWKLNVATCLDATREAAGKDAEGLSYDFHGAIKAMHYSQEGRPWNGATNLTLPAFVSISKKAAEVQTKLHCCRLGIALERHRLKTGVFPDSLDALAPGLIAKIPSGPVTGKAPVYAKNTDGGYTLSFKGEDFANADLESDNPVGKDIVWTMPAPKAR